MSYALYRLNHYRLLLITGVDAKKFLQGQVTCDIDSLTIQTHSDNATIHSSTIGAHCTHKGRIVFSFRALTLDDNTIGLYIPADMVDIATTALQKYIVFSKADIINTQDEYCFWGVDTQATGLVSSLFGEDALSINVNTAYKNDKGIVLCVEHNRYEIWLNQQQAATPLESATLLDNALWDRATMHLGIAEIHPETSGVFTPHAIGFHNIEHAISFDKGCYTGQEVVARMQYLGKLKSQLYLFELSANQAVDSASATIGAALYTRDKSQSIGEIVNLSTTQQNTLILASAKSEQVRENTVYIDQDCQHKLNLLTD